MADNALRACLVCELVNDHEPTLTMVKAAVGLLYAPPATTNRTSLPRLPRLVACGDPAMVARIALRPTDEQLLSAFALSVNEIVYDRHDGTAHLTRTSVTVLTGIEQVVLHTFGRFSPSVGGGYLELLAPPAISAADRNCARRVCRKPNATWYNKSTHLYYCPMCAWAINAQPGQAELCVFIPEHAVGAGA